MNDYSFFVYITTNSSRRVLYTGFTNNLSQRLVEHYMNRGTNKSFAGKFYSYNLLYYEVYQYVYDAMDREKEIKVGTRIKKLELIKLENPKQRFLNKEIMDWPPTDPVHR